MADDDSLRPRRVADRRARLRENLVLFVAVPLGWGGLFLALFWLYATYEPLSIPSGSMQPILNPGEYIMARKDYFRTVEPARGELIVFRLPGERRKILYLKRVVGLPGEEIQMVRGILHINGSPVDRMANGDQPVVGLSGSHDRAPVYIETLPGGRSHTIIETMGDDAPQDNMPAHLIPPGHYFVLGDNRDRSADSRVFGPVPAESLLHRPLFLFWSKDLSRIGMRVH